MKGTLPDEGVLESILDSVSKEYVEDEEEEGKPAFGNLKRVVWHEAFWVLLAVVAHWAQYGHAFKCGDDVVRVLYPIILLLVSDYEEQ